MSRRVNLPVTLELCSDAVFGSGYSIPGGEDIAVCRDGRGYPYVTGPTWKGLLRESLENLAAWGGADAGDADALLGREGWSGLADGRRLRLTELTLTQPPVDPEDCFDLRTFTALENGIVKQGTLRTAACVRRGLTFSGQIQCDEDDVPLLRDALWGIKWAGAMRSRGFGRVRFAAEEARPVEAGGGLPAGGCLRYRLRASLPIVVTDQIRSTGNSYETQGFLPGSAVRGAVAGRIAAGDPAWFEDHKTALLSDGVRFLDAVPAPLPAPVLPSIRGFYEDKEGKRFESVVIDGAFTPGLKRAKLGAFCALEGDTVRYWSARTGGATRIQRGKGGEDSKPFQVRHLSAGQEFEGYILLDDPELAARVSQALGDALWLGADRYAGFGRCEVTAREAVEGLPWQEAYGYRGQEEIGTRLYLLAVSPLTMLDEAGNPCGLDEGRLARLLGVERVEILHCATALTEAGGYNRAWESRAPLVRLYDRGSLFQLKCTSAPALERIRRVEAQGLGIRREEGFGQVLFLRPELLEGLRNKAALERGEEAGSGRQARLRRAKYHWIMEQSGKLSRWGLSRSQVGEIQVLCEKARANGGDWKELDDHLEHNLTNRGALHGARFQEAAELIQGVLGRPLGETLKLENCPDSEEARLELLCLLFDHSRKGRREN